MRIFGGFAVAFQSFAGRLARSVVGQNFDAAALDALVRADFEKGANPHAAGIVRRAAGWQNVIGTADFIGIHHRRILSDEERAIIA